MKKLLLLAAAVVALTVTAKPAAAQAPAQAQAPASGAQPGCAQCGDPGAGAGYGGGYGGFMGKSKGGWFSSHLHGIFSNHHSDPRQMLPVAQGGQLAFPQNPFIRGPRDYFMWDEK